MNVFIQNILDDSRLTKNVPFLRRFCACHRIRPCCYGSNGTNAQFHRLLCLSIKDKALSCLLGLGSGQLRLKHLLQIAEFLYLYLICFILLAEDVATGWISFNVVVECLSLIIEINELLYDRMDLVEYGELLACLIVCCFLIFIFKVCRLWEGWYFSIEESGLIYSSCTW